MRKMRTSILAGVLSASVALAAEAPVYAAAQPIWLEINQTYYLKEVKAPDGYNRETHILKGVISGNKLVITYADDPQQIPILEADMKSWGTQRYIDTWVVNTPGFELPETGANGTWGYRVSGILLILSAIHLLKRKR